MSEREELIQIYSDFYKDAYGVRPRFNYSEKSLEELKADFKSFGEICEENRKMEDIHTKKCIQDFNKSIDSLILLGAGDEETALRWLVEAEVGSVQDPEHFVWNQGFLYTEYGRQLVKRVTPMFSKLWNQN